MSARFAAALVAALALFGCARPSEPSAQAGPPVNIEDAAQVRAVVRDYLINDPTVLEDALEALAERTQARRNAALLSDPRDVSIGPADAPIVIVEFFDYRCPYCQAAMDWVFETIQSRRDVRVVFKEYPVLGPESLEASKAAIASIPQGRYRAFHYALMRHRGDLTSAQIDAVARDAGVDVVRMRRDMDNPEIARLIDDNHAAAADAQITGTPAFLINGEWVRGFNRELLRARLAEATREARRAERASAQTDAPTR